MRFTAITLAVALVACAQSAQSQPPAGSYPEAYAGAPANPLENAIELAHRAIARAQQQKETIQLACLRDKESKLESLRAEGASLTPAEVDASARRLQSETERCVGGE